MRKQVEILGVPIDVVTQEEAILSIIQFLNQGGFKKVYTPNPEIIMLAQKDKELMRILKEGDLVIPDGIGLIIASKIKRLGLKERVTGIDTMHHLLLYCAEEGKSIFLLGGKPGVAEKACKNIERQYKGIQIGGCYHGYFNIEEEKNIIKKINESNSEVLFVCLGSPKQEKWINQNKEKINCKLAMGVGGSVDIYGGTAKRAPILFQKLGLEWFYRLLREPWRYKRMMVLPQFIGQVILKPKKE